MKPIKDCQYAQNDSCCGYPKAPTPECHIDACPRLAWFVGAILARGERLCEVLADDYGEDMPANLILPVVELEAAIAASESPSQMADAWTDAQDGTEEGGNGR
jgi:hypothetical protein